MLLNSLFRKVKWRRSVLFTHGPDVAIVRNPFRNKYFHWHSCGIQKYFGWEILQDIFCIAILYNARYSIGPEHEQQNGARDTQKAIHYLKSWSKMSKAIKILNIHPGTHQNSSGVVLLAVKIIFVSIKTLYFHCAEKQCFHSSAGPCQRDGSPRLHSGAHKCC